METISETLPVNVCVSNDQKSASFFANPNIIKTKTKMTSINVNNNKSIIHVIIFIRVLPTNILRHDAVWKCGLIWSDETFHLVYEFRSKYFDQYALY